MPDVHLNLMLNLKVAKDRKGLAPNKPRAEHGVRPHLLASAPHGSGVMWVRPDPLILGKEFAEEGGGAVSHPDGQPGGAGSMFIPQLAR
jgi:hypothetical protein